MMTLDHVGDQEAMVHAQLGHQPLARTTETSLQPRQGTLSCLSTQPPALAFCMDRDTAPGGDHVPEHCPVSILQAHGGDAIPHLALWTIDRFVRFLSQPLVELPLHQQSSAAQKAVGEVRPAPEESRSAREKRKKCSALELDPP